MRALLCLWELQSQILQLYSTRPGDVSGNDTVIQSCIMRLGVCKKALQTFCDSLVLSWFGVRLPSSSLQVSIQLCATIDTG